jgi:hypothetical protein
MSDDVRKDCVNVGVITGSQLTGLLNEARSFGEAVGMVRGYREILAHLRAELDGADTELLRTPESPVVLGTIIALGKVVVQLEPAHERYVEQIERVLGQLAESCACIGIGIGQDDNPGVGGADASAARH